ncbi:MAG: tRNA (adenosine(37)-N6)-dimethylallyltransferase MiaA [Candidatus Berkiella sp.]
MPNSSPIICILGPTASGKTNLSLALGEHFPIEIINVDSAQVYKGLDIGSGKPSREQREQVPHHLMDMLDPKELYNAAQFCHDATLAIKDILSRKKIPVLVGGTMLYFKALQQGLSELPESDPSIRQQLEKQLQEKGLANLYQRLQTVDSERASQIKPTDPQRILRALEIFEKTGKTMSQWLSLPKTALHNYDFINIGILPEETSREVLHQRIALRFDEMLSQGLIEEVKALYDRGDLNDSMPAIRAVGYRQVWQYLSGDLSHDDMRDRAIAATRQLAKRQLTWLRSWPQLLSFDLNDPAMQAKVGAILNKAWLE